MFRAGILAATAAAVDMDGAVAVAGKGMRKQVTGERGGVVNSWVSK
jgi:hypothetical protein